MVRKRRTCLTCLTCLAFAVLSTAQGGSAMAAERAPAHRAALVAPVAATRTAVLPSAAPKSMRKLSAMRGGFVVGAVSRVARLAWRLLRIQLIILAVVQVWPIPFVVFFYWLMHAWFGSEGTSMIAFTGLR